MNHLDGIKVLSENINTRIIGFSWAAAIIGCVFMLILLIMVTRIVFGKHFYLRWNGRLN